LGDNFLLFQKSQADSKQSEDLSAFVEQPSGDKAAVVFGEVEIVSDLKEKRRVLKLATFDLSQHFPKGPESKELCLLKITAKKIEWRERWEGGAKIYKPS
jgi:general stress protein 26